ncbi:MAG: hypothetical protein KGI06_04105 [Candidatus Micrarchaeota archaeon]|nr:hypothetical protein [Candidatus Micrarchaeota archaeon]
MLFPGQNKDMPAKELSAQDILRIINFDYQYSQIGRPPSKEEIGNAIDSLSPRKMDAMQSQYGNKLYYELGRYVTADASVIDNPRITDVTRYVQERIMGRMDLLSLSDGDMPLVVSFVLNGKADVIDRIIGRQDIMRMQTMYGGEQHRIKNDIILDSRFTVAHLIVSLAEKGDERINERSLDRIIDTQGVALLRDSKGESVADIIERIATRWRDSSLLSKARKAKTGSEQEAERLNEAISQIGKLHGEEMAKLVRSFDDDPGTQGKLIGRLLKG